MKNIDFIGIDAYFPVTESISSDISQAQLKKFTDVTSVNNNYRLTQPLGTRKIKDVETSTKRFSPSGAPAA